MHYACPLVQHPTPNPVLENEKTNDEKKVTCPECLSWLKKYNDAFHKDDRQRLFCGGKAPF